MILNKALLVVALICYLGVDYGKAQDQSLSSVAVKQPTEAIVIEEVYVVNEDEDELDMLPEITPEDELVELEEEHEEMEEVCASMKSEIDEAIAAGQPVDAELQADYDDCMTILEEIEADMGEVQVEIDNE